MAQILQSLGAEVKTSGNTVSVHAHKIKSVGDYELIRKMRGSICIAGPLLGRLRRTRVSLPGGCIIGARPIGLHLKGFEALGTKITIESGYVNATAKKLKGTEIFLGGRAGSTVLGTANVMMAATLADVVDLAEFLTAMGAKISGAGSPTITITGVKKLHGAEHEVIPDRIEAATYAIAAAATNGCVTLRGARADHMHAILDKLQEAGVKIERSGTSLTVSRKGKLKPVDITTLPYAGFPTDVQAQMMVLMCLTPGISIITERIFEARFMHVSELARLGAATSAPPRHSSSPVSLRAARPRCNAFTIWIAATRTLTANCARSAHAFNALETNDY
jgi:UDP-N-acetylglucosamine 1-carboxyvinyltransferase